MSRIRRSAQVPGDMWAWFALGTVQYVAFGWLVIFEAPWPLPVRIAAAVVLVPICVWIIRLLSRWVGE